MTDHLVARNLCYAYGPRRVVQDVSLALAPGRTAVLLGPSGAGKSTLIALLAGLLEPAAGELILSPSAGGAPRRVDWRALRVGIVFQSPALWDHLRVEEHLSLVLSGQRLDRRQRRARIDVTLDRLGLAPLRRRRPGELSGGERRRVAIARALVVRPAVLLLDEPLAHLDGPLRQELFGLLRDALADTAAAILLATHSPHEALRLANEALVMLDGRIVQAGGPQQVYRDPVSLAAARMLGPADELRGVARGGTLLADTAGAEDGAALLEGLPPELRGPHRVIVRPEWLAFAPDPLGPAVVERCEFAAGGFLLTVRAGGQRGQAASREPVAAGTAGRLGLLSPRVPGRDGPPALATSHAADPTA